jgi:hypothetical protein
MVNLSLVFMGQKLMVEPKGGGVFPNQIGRFSWEDHKKNMGTYPLVI